MADSEYQIDVEETSNGETVIDVYDGDEWIGGAVGKTFEEAIRRLAEVFTPEEPKPLVRTEKEKEYDHQRELIRQRYGTDTPPSIADYWTRGGR